VASLVSSLRYFDTVTWLLVMSAIAASLALAVFSNRRACEVFHVYTDDLTGEKFHLYFASALEVPFMTALWVLAWLTSGDTAGMVSSRNPFISVAGYAWLVFVPVALLATLAVWILTVRMQLTIYTSCLTKDGIARNYERCANPYWVYSISDRMGNAHEGLLYYLAFAVVGVFIPLAVASGLAHEQVALSGFAAALVAMLIVALISVIGGR